MLLLILVLLLNFNTLLGHSSSYPTFLYLMQKQQIIIILNDSADKKKLIKPHLSPSIQQMNFQQLKNVEKNNIIIIFDTSFFYLRINLLNLNDKVKQIRFWGSPPKLQQQRQQQYFKKLSSCFFISNFLQKLLMPKEDVIQLNKQIFDKYFGQDKKTESKYYYYQNWKIFKTLSRKQQRRYNFEIVNQTRYKKVSGRYYSKYQQYPFQIFDFQKHQFYLDRDHGDVYPFHEQEKKQQVYPFHEQVSRQFGRNIGIWNSLCERIQNNSFKDQDLFQQEVMNYQYLLRLQAVKKEIDTGQNNRYYFGLNKKDFKLNKDSLIQIKFPFRVYPNQLKQHKNKSKVMFQIQPKTGDPLPFQFNPIHYDGQFRQIQQKQLKWLIYPGGMYKYILKEKAIYQKVQFVKEKKDVPMYQKIREKTQKWIEDLAKMGERGEGEYQIQAYRDFIEKIRKRLSNNLPFPFWGKGQLQDYIIKTKQEYL